MKYCSASSWSFNSFSWPSASCFSLKRNQKSVSHSCRPTERHSRGASHMLRLCVCLCACMSTVCIRLVMMMMMMRVSDLRSSWFCFSKICFMSSSWLSSCLSCFSEERSADTCWFCIFRSLWLKVRLWISCSRRKVRCVTCRHTCREAVSIYLLLKSIYKSPGSKIQLQNTRQAAKGLRLQRIPRL